MMLFAPVCFKVNWDPLKIRIKSITENNKLDLCLVTRSKIVNNSWLLAVLSEMLSTLQKHAYSNILKILQPKKGKFSDKNSDIFHILSQNIDCGYSLEPPRRGGSNEYCRGGSNEYPQPNFFSKIRTIMYTPVNPSFSV